MKQILLPILVLLFAFNVNAQTDTLTHKKKFDFEKVRKTKAIFTDEEGALIGIGGLAANKYWFSYQSVSAYQFDPHGYFGPGFGVEVTGKNGVLLNPGVSKTAVMFPVFGEVRYSFLSKRVSPYISQKAGYSFYGAGPKPSSTIIGGAMMETQLGIKTFFSPKGAVNISVGYRLQCLAIPPSYSGQFSDLPMQVAGGATPAKKLEYYNFLSIHAGFTY